MHVLIAIVLLALPLSAAAAPPIPQVEVLNFPDPQNVTGSVSISNLPTVQGITGEVEVSNLPDVQDVNVRNDDREQVEIGMTVFVGERKTGLIFGPNRPTIPLLVVPFGMKLVITDLLVHHNIGGESEVLGANILRADEDTNCTDGPLGSRMQLFVGPGGGTNVSMTTGIEFLPGQQVCVGTGGAASNPNLGLLFQLYGYLTPL